jgi:hypothetical protein
MPDPYASIAQTDAALKARLAGVLELRAADPQQGRQVEVEFERASAVLGVDDGAAIGSVADHTGRRRGAGWRLAPG